MRAAESDNDTFGRAEGDAALQIIAETIKKACSGTRAFAACYGGDEFIVLLEAPRYAPLKETEETIHAGLAESSKKLPFELTVSMDMAEYDPKMGGARQFFDVADINLYAQKAKLAE